MQDEIQVGTKQEEQTYHNREKDKKKCEIHQQWTKRRRPYDNRVKDEDERCVRTEQNKINIL